MRFGPWMMAVFRLLAALRGLRGTPFDVFGYSRERRAEQGMIQDYLADLDLVSQHLDSRNHALALDLLSWPESVRGFGDIKLSALEAAQERRAGLRATLCSAGQERDAA
jgi:indolepyruvate ferredoxin oxidoreductase